MPSDNSSKQLKFSREVNGLLTAICGSLVGMVQGYNTTLSALLLYDPTFISKFNPKNENPYFSIKFILIIFFGIIFGALLSSPLADRLGRRTVLQYTSLLGIILIIWSATAESAADIFTSRSLVGWITGIGMSVGPVYAAEMTSSSERGQVVGFMSFATIVGSMFAGICYYITRYWRICMLFPCTFLAANAVLLIFVFPRESPRWLLARKTPAECLHGLQSLRRIHDVSVEFNVIYQVLSSDATQGDSWSDLMLSSSYLYRIFICIILQLCMTCTGILMITTLSYPMLSMIYDHHIYLGISLAMISSMIGVLFGLVYIDQVGRRWLMMIGSIGVSSCWISLAACMYYTNIISYDDNHHMMMMMMRFIFGSILCLFTFIYSISYGIIAYVIPVEVFPMRFRAKASSINIIINSISNMINIIILHTYLNSSSSLSSLASLFISFACISMILGVIVYVGMPETKSLMLENMEDLFIFDDINTSSSSSSSLYCCCPCCYYDVSSSTPASSSLALNMTSPSSSSSYGSIIPASSSSSSSSKHIRSNQTSSHHHRGSYHMMGHRIIPPDQLLQNILLKSSSSSSSYHHMTALSNSNASISSGALLEPTTLHKYSHDMRELKFEFYADESEPLVKHHHTSSSPASSSSSSSHIKADHHDTSSSSLYSYMQAPVSAGKKKVAVTRSFASSLIPEPLSHTRSNHKSASNSNV